MKIKQPLTFAILVGVLSSASYAAEWSYSGEHGAKHWGKMFTTCGEGKNQTPININSITKAELAPLHIQYKGRISELTNNGHTVQANVTAGSTLNIDGGQFELKQFHFHTPSENYLKGKQYPLEAHFVHANTNGQLAVIGVMFDTGPRANAQLSRLLKSVPEEGETLSLTAELNPADLLPKEREYYRFNGSLTTPPCSEGVRWFVMKEPLTSSDQQTQALHQIMGDNARPLQPLNARLVLE